MDTVIGNRLALPAQFFKALSHTSRLYMIEKLVRGEMCVQELTSLVGADMSTVSRHLAVLRTAGIVGEAKRSNRIFYSLRGGEVSRFVSAIPDLTRRLADERLAQTLFCGAKRSPVRRRREGKERMLPN